MASRSGSYTLCYTFRGDGDVSAATAVQSRLREYGICSYFNWDPRPPQWRFFYETNLSQADIRLQLGNMIPRFGIRIEK